MKKKNKKPRFLVLKPGAYLYIFLLLVSLIFTQALRSSASAIIFIFLMLVPILSVIYLVIARSGIKVYTECDNTRVDKGDTVSYEIKIINETPVPFPFVETIVTLPTENAVMCLDNLMRITLLPSGCHLITSEVSFPLRGSYDIGVKYLYIGDLFGLFRTEMKLELHRTVIVYPRSITMSADANRSDTDLPTPVTKRSVSSEQAEPSDIRNYVPGDSMKNIHWKLSSKSEELQVKNFSSNTDKHTYILCDLSFNGNDEPAEAGNKKKAVTEKKKAHRRRGKTSSSAGVAAAKAVGNASGNAGGTTFRSTAERLEALGVTPEHLAALEGFDEAEEISIIDKATRKGEKNARKLAARKRARLAISIAESERTSNETVKKSPFVEENISFAGEICADSVIELALSLMRHEARSGANCTVVYPDARSDSGLGVLSSANDVPEDLSLLQFFTAPVCRDKEAFARLGTVLEQSAGMTIRMVSANTDIYSAAVFSSIPAAFGGAGSGCAAEVLLASPEGLWVSSTDKNASAEAMISELARSGVTMRQFTTEPGNDGSLRFTSAV